MLKQITLAAIIALGLSAETIGNVNSAFKKGEKKPRLGILNNSILLLWLIATAVYGQPQTSRASSAASYLECGNSWMAKGEIERAIAFDSRSVLAYYNRAVARGLNGDLDGAVRDYDLAIELNPRCVGAYLNSGAIRYGQGERAARIKDFSRVIEFNPRDARAWNNRGRARSDEGDLAGAIADFNQAIKLDSRNAIVWSNRSAIHRLQGALDAALADNSMIYGV